MDPRTDVYSHADLYSNADSKLYAHSDVNSVAHRHDYAHADPDRAPPKGATNAKATADAHVDGRATAHLSSEQSDLLAGRGDHPSLGVGWAAGE
jgi:hypothetical protein